MARRSVEQKESIIIFVGYVNRDGAMSKCIEIGGDDLAQAGSTTELWNRDLVLQVATHVGWPEILGSTKCTPEQGTQFELSRSISATFNPINDCGLYGRWFWRVHN